MNDFNNYFFGSLPKDYCMLFLFISMFVFVSLVIYLISAIYIGITTKKRMDYYLTVTVIGLMYGLKYFEYRLLHNMCANSLTA